MSRRDGQDVSPGPEAHTASAVRTHSHVGPPGSRRAARVPQSLGTPDNPQPSPAGPDKATSPGPPLLGGTEALRLGSFLVLALGGYADLGVQGERRLDERLEVVARRRLDLAEPDGIAAGSVVAVNAVVAVVAFQQRPAVPV